jgi:hypothetical protein
MNTFLKFQLKSSIQSAVVGSFLAAVTVAVAVVGPATAWADGLKAVPFEFVGKAGDCGTGYPAGSRIVTAKWLKGLGLPDNGDKNFNTTTPSDPPSKKDRHSGLLLSKNGATPVCASAGAEIKGVKGMVVTDTFTVGYDFRNGGHCGAGAPRFNIDTDMGFFFVGCANAPKIPAPQDPAEWTRTRSVLKTCGIECFPGPFPSGARINSINIVFDEGTDTANNDTEGVGLAVLDNIFINGAFITREQGEGHHDGKDKDDDDDD